MLRKDIAFFVALVLLLALVCAFLVPFFNRFLNFSTVQSIDTTTVTGRPNQQ